MKVRESEVSGQMANYCLRTKKSIRRMNKIQRIRKIKMLNPDMKKARGFRYGKYVKWHASTLHDF